MRVIGLMSGTSLDGIDAAIVRFDGDLNDLAWELEAFLTVPLDAQRRQAIHDAIVDGTAAVLCRLNANLGEWFAEAALLVCEEAGISPADVDVIGSHGQTIWHEPPTRSARGATLQLGCAATIAERTGIDVVSDFRTRDVAAGGQGAPLVSWVDRALFSAHHARVLLNIGGMANLTLVPPRGNDASVLAFDTGPGNALINAAVEIATAGRETFDRDGERAAAGQINEPLLIELLAHPFYSEQPPKSTGRETFGKPFVEELARRMPNLRLQWNDVIATLTELTAATVADAVRTWALEHGPEEVIVTGGGARNPELMRRIAQRLAPLPVRAGDSLGLDPDAKEAVAFAALAWAHCLGIPGNVPSATGAAGPRVLGSFTPGLR